MPPPQAVLPFLDGHQHEVEPEADVLDSRGRATPLPQVPQAGNPLSRHSILEGSDHVVLEVVLGAIQVETMPEPDKEGLEAETEEG